MNDTTNHINGTRDIEYLLRKVGVICPECGIGHTLGDIKVLGQYTMAIDVFHKYKDSLITPKLSALLPIDPSIYDNSTLALKIKCYNCESPMIMVPEHLLGAIEAFNSWKIHTTGVYFKENIFGYVTHLLRSIYFIDVNFLLTAMIDRVEQENIEITPVYTSGTCDKGIPLVWEFDVSATKDQSFASLNQLQIVRGSDGHSGYLVYSPEYYEAAHVTSKDATASYLDAISIIMEFLCDWHESIIDGFIKDNTTTDPFREFYREKYQWLHADDISQSQMLHMNLQSEFNYPAMTK